jgi:hypothetical protein
LEAYRKTETAEAQVEVLAKLDVRWDLLADAAKSPEVWEGIAVKMGPQALRMNLNTLVRHEVFGPRAGTASTIGRPSVGGRPVQPRPPAGPVRLLDHLP